MLAHTYTHTPHAQTYKSMQYINRKLELLSDATTTLYI